MRQNTDHLRCPWATTEPAIAYHDKEWGVPDSTSASSGDNARLVVNRAANFGILESISDDAVLRPGQHVLSISMNPKTDGQKPTQRRVNAKPGKIYAFTAVWRNAEYASLEQ